MGKLLNKKSLQTNMFEGIFGKYLNFTFITYLTSRKATGFTFKIDYCVLR